MHMLRHEIQNDDLFFEVLETFQTDFTSGTATGEDFKNTAEHVFSRRKRIYPEDEIYPGNEWRIFSGRLSYDKGLLSCTC